MLEELCRKYRRPVTEILSRRRGSDLVNDRASIAKELSAEGLTYPQIGAIMNRCHTSIMHLVDDVRRERRKKEMVKYSGGVKAARSQIDARSN